MFTSLQKILPQAITKLGMKREIEAALICEKYRKLAPQFIHRAALDHTFPKYYRRKILTVGVENSGWAHHLVMRKKELIEAINTSMEKSVIKDIKTKITDEPSDATID